MALQTRAADARLIGRDDELAIAGDVLARAADGVLSACAIVGEGGIGKSTLLAVVAERAAADGFVVHLGRGDDLDRSRPLRVILDALDEDATVDGDDVFQVLESIGARLEASALQSPVLLALDDLQWADAASAAGARVLARRLADLPVALLLARRPAPRVRDIDHLVVELTAAGAPTIALGPLEPEAVRAIVASRAGEDVDDALVARVARAGGNPLFVGELLDSVDDGVPDSVRDAVLRRIDALPNATSHVLRLASVLGTAFRPGDLATVSARPVAELLPDLQPALDDGIVSADGPRLAFRHDLVRAAIYDDMPEGVRAALHVEAAIALGAASAPASDLAPHLSIGARGDDTRAIDLLVRVASEVTDPALAVELGERCFDLLPLASPPRDAVTSRMIGQLNLLGRNDEAERLAKGVLARPHDTALDVDLYGGWWNALMHQNRYAELIDVATAAAIEDPMLSARRDAIVADTRLLSGDLAGAEHAARRLAASDLFHDPKVAVTVEADLAWIAAARGNVTEALERGASASALRSATPAAIQSAHVYYGICLMDADRFDDARVVLRRGRDEDLERGWRVGVPLFHWALGGVAFLSGDLDTTAAEIEAGAAVVDEGGVTAQGSLFRCALGGAIAVFRGDLATASSALADGEAIVGASGPQMGIDLFWWTKARWQEATGDERAYETLAAAWDLTEPIRYLLTWRTTAPDLVRMALAAGDRSRALDVTAAAHEGARRAPDVASAAATARRCQALLDGDADALAAAADLLATSPRRLDAAVAMLEAAELLGARGDRVGAGKRWEVASATLRELGADGLVDRAQERLAAHRVKVAPRVRRAVSGWESLTPAETRVAELVAKGHTNPEVAAALFVSRHTVESHVRHTLAKLGMRSRVELAAAAARRSS